MFEAAETIDTLRIRPLPFLYMIDKDVLSKASLPLSIVIAAIVLGIAFYAVQAHKQESIERQQMRELEEKRVNEGAKAELEKKEYSASRKLDCLKIYTTESDKYNNVQSWRYEDEADKCFLRYKERVPKSEAECDKTYPFGKDDDDFDWGYSLFFSNSLCKEGSFENEF